MSLRVLIGLLRLGGFDVLRVCDLQIRGHLLPFLADQIPAQQVHKVPLHGGGIVAVGALALVIRDQVGEGGGAVPAVPEDTGDYSAAALPVDAGERVKKPASTPS